MAWLLAACVGLALVAALIGGNTWRQHQRLTLGADSPAARWQQIARDLAVIRPPGGGTHPAAVLLSGCDGVHDNMHWWAGVLAARGYTAIILDSHRFRGLDAYETWRLVCTLQTLSGAERAGDLAVLLANLDRVEGASGQGVLVLGASHGGWTAMELMALAASGAVPPGLTGWPEPPAGMMARLGSMVLLYPYCGVLSRADEASWQAAPPTLMLLAEEDSVVSTPNCLAMAGRLERNGARIAMTVLPGVDHGFDQQEKAVFSTLVFDARARDAARQAVEAFLDRQGAPAQPPR